MNKPCRNFTEEDVLMAQFADFSRLTLERKKELTKWMLSLSADEKSMLRDLQQDARNEDFWPGA